MGFVDKLLGRAGAPEADAPSEHAVLVRFGNFDPGNLESLFALESQLEEAIASSGAGEFDGNELATDGSDGTLYMYGPDAKRLFAVVRPILEASPLMRDARVTLRYGSPGDDSREELIVLGV